MDDDSDSLESSSLERETNDEEWRVPSQKHATSTRPLTLIMVSIPLNFIDQKLLAWNAVQHFYSPFPEVPDVYAGFLGNLANSYSNREVQMPTKQFHVTSGPANEQYDHVVFQENFREESQGIVVDHFTIQSRLFGIFYLTHIREFDHDNATICTIRRNPMAQSAWIPVRREFRYQFDYREWLGSRMEWWLIDIGQPSTITPNNLISVFVDGYRYWVKEQNDRYARSHLLFTIFLIHMYDPSCLFNPEDPRHICWYNLPDINSDNNPKLL